MEVLQVRVIFLLFTVVIVLSILLSSLKVFSQGFQVNLEGQKQIGMGGAGTATSLDAASVLYNPGALVFQKANSVMAGISPLFLRVAYLGLAPSTYKANFETLSPPFSAYAAYSLHNPKFKLGLGVYTPFGGSAKWSPSWEGKYILQTLRLRSVFFQPTVSYQVSARLGLGVGMVFGTGTVDLQRAIPLSDSLSRDGEAQLKCNASGLGFNAGLYYKATSKVTLGLAYRSGVKIKAKAGTATFQVPQSLALSFPAGSFTTTLNLPYTLSLGCGYSPGDRLLVSAEIDLVGWSPYKSLEFDYVKTTSLLTNTVSPRNYTNSYDLRAGAQYDIKHGLFVRGGVSYGATPVKSGYVTPEAPDANRIELSAGLGYSIKQFITDASFLYVDIMKRTQTNIESNFGGTFKTNAYIPGVSCTYRF